MDNQHEQITGYRDLSQSEIDAINSVKAAEVDLAALWKQVGEIPGVDGRLRAIAKTHFEEGFTALVKSIARPADPYA